jgi:hypothetical protein
MVENMIGIKIQKQKSHNLFLAIDKSIIELIKDIFSSHYTEFLLNFGNEELMASLAV